MPNDTVMVLVDPNNGGKPYYSTFGSAYDDGSDNIIHNGVIRLSEFHETLGSSLAIDKFEPVSMYELIKKAGASFVATMDNNNGSYVPCSASEATIMATLSGVETPFKYDSNPSTTPRYNITITGTDLEDEDGNLPVNESYYLSFFTDDES